jgi:hypothetical protein
MGELRIRNVPKELSDKFKKVEQHFKVVESTKAIEMLIRQFFEDQKTISWQRNQLRIQQDRIDAMQQSKSNVKYLIWDFVDLTKKNKGQADYFIKTGTNLIKKLSAKPKAKKKGGKK